MQARERLLALAVGAIAGLWLVDVLAIEPGLAWYRAVQEDIRTTGRAVAEARNLIDRADRIHAVWRGQHAAGLLDREDAARFLLQQALAGGARSSGLTLDSVGGGQRLPAAHGTAYDTIRCAVSGQGSLKEVLAFLAALDGAGLPLRVERCELAARDGRKDQLDLALTVSTRLASAEAAKTRRIPDGQKPWQPEARDAAVDQAILKAKPFLSERRSERRASAAAVATAPAATPTGLALVGVSLRPGAVRAFLRDVAGGDERQVAPGERLGEATVTAIDGDGLHLTEAGGGERLVAVGFSLAGQPLGNASTGRTTVAGTSASGATTGGVSAAAPPADADREAILQRLRQQRNRNR